MKLTDDIYVYEWTNYFDNNCNSFYIGGGINALVDPGLTRYLPNLLERMADDGIKREDIAYVINTHSHPDHFQASEMFDPEEVKIA
ncbi:MAG: MBL fold metallo-hydrolase, partial [Smithellaceae bacterium]